MHTTPPQKNTICNEKTKQSRWTTWKTGQQWMTEQILTGGVGVRDGKVKGGRKVKKTDEVKESLCIDSQWHHSSELSTLTWPKRDQLEINPPHGWLASSNSNQSDFLRYTLGQWSSRTLLDLELARLNTFRSTSRLDLQSQRSFQAIKCCFEHASTKWSDTLFCLICTKTIWKFRLCAPTTPRKLLKNTITLS